MDFEQLAFIERWRTRALRGVVVALDGTRGDLLVTMRVGDLGVALDLRGRDATGAARRARLAIGDRITMAIEYAAAGAEVGASPGVTGGLVAPGAVIDGIVGETGDVVTVDLGAAAMLVRGDTLPGVSPGDVVRFTVAAEGRAFLIPTR